ncbi:MAG: ABC transporter permease [Gemmataceae bacterium]
MTFLGFLLKNLLHRKARTTLTILGVAVAMATIVTLRGVAHGFETSFQANFEQRGADLIITQAGVPDQLRSDLEESYGPRVAAIPGVAHIIPGLVELVDFQRGEGTHSAIVNGWRIGESTFDDLKMLSGRAFQEGDRRKILLGTTLARNLRKQVGDQVEVQRQKFEVVGVYDSFTLYENGGAVLPLAELQELMLRKGSVTGFSIMLESGPNKNAMMERVQAEIEALTDSEGKAGRVTAQTTRDYVSKAMPIRLAHGMAWVTSFIALIIGGISMLNTMIMSVMERTREIGILRAIGWRMRRVVWMVLGEALILSLAATAVGTVGAFVALRWLAYLPQTNGFISGHLSPAVLVEGLFMTVVLALLGGTYPAYRAAQWAPSEALRHE